MKFGDFLKQARVQKRLTLRQCAFELGIDPSNWSKIERGILPPPKDDAVLLQWADFFNLDSARREEFRDLASLARKELPKDMATDEEVLAVLPAFFRAVRGRELDKTRLGEFIEDIRSLHSGKK